MSTTTQIATAATAGIVLLATEWLVVRRKLRDAHHRGFMKGIDSALGNPRAAKLLVDDPKSGAEP